MNVCRQGVYETKGGYTAIACQTRVSNFRFVLRGAVKEQPDANVYIMTAWDLEGKNLGIQSEAFDLVQASRKQ